MRTGTRLNASAGQGKRWSAIQLQGCMPMIDEIGAIDDNASSNLLRRNQRRPFRSASEVEFQFFEKTVIFRFDPVCTAQRSLDSGWTLSCTASGPQLHGSLRSTGLRPMPPHYSRDLEHGPGAGSGLLPRLPPLGLLLCGFFTAVSRSLF
jgi:hypothetical protein